MLAKRNTQFRIGFVLIDGFALMSYAAAIEPLRAANQLFVGPAPYYIRHIAIDGTYATSSSGAQIPASAAIGEALEYELVIVVAGGNPVGFQHPKLFSWLRRLDRHGVALGGVSGGPVVLASAGLLHGRRMTLHWEHIPALAERDPSLLIEKALYVFDRDRVTCAGGMAAIDMMHRMISLHRGQDLARKVSDWFLHTEIRVAGGPQRSGLVDRYNTTNATVLSALEVMETHIADPISLAQVAAVSGSSPRHLVRLFLASISCSPMRFYLRLRLEKARSLLVGSALSLTDVALSSGFASSAHFSRAFVKEYGAPPSHFRRRMLSTK